MKKFWTLGSYNCGGLIIVIVIYYMYECRTAKFTGIHSKIILGIENRKDVITMVRIKNRSIGIIKI